MKLDELKKLCDEATPGPWFYRKSQHEKDLPTVRDKFGGEIACTSACGYLETDAAFIAAARTALPKLIAVVEAGAAWHEAIRLHEVAVENGTADRSSASHVAILRAMERHRTALAALEAE